MILLDDELTPRGRSDVVLVLMNLVVCTVAVDCLEKAIMY